MKKTEGRAEYKNSTRKYIAEIFPELDDLHVGKQLPPLLKKSTTQPLESPLDLVGKNKAQESDNIDDLP